MTKGNELRWERRRVKKEGERKIKSEENGGIKKWKIKKRD